MGHPNTNRGLQDLSRAGFDHLAQRFGDRSGLVAGHTLHDHQKLLATPSRHRILHPHAGLQDLGNSLQNAISGVMAVLVIDCFEMINIDHHHRVAALPCGKKVKCTLCDPSVGNTRQGVGIGCLAQSIDTLCRFPQLVTFAHPDAQKPGK